MNSSPIGGDREAAEETRGMREEEGKPERPGERTLGLIETRGRRRST